MTEFSLRLPARKLSVELIARLDQETRDQFNAQLLDALWDAHEAGTLPATIVVLLRDWTAKAHFADSPVVQERLAEARGNGATP
ncbi:MAG TPA: hypothetical protein VJA46_09095 [Acidimicrobiia bacterium]|nr:hypothetical protein [Acidimicrobiia bacterium]